MALISLHSPLGRVLLASVTSLSLVLSPALADDFGYYGAVFPVIEPSLLDTIFARLGEMEDNGELDAMRDEMQQTTRDYVRRPRPVMGLGLAETYRHFEIDLSIIVAQDIADHNGVVFARAGTRVNPLDHSRFNQRLVVIDGDDADQVAFALGIANSEPAKIIIINGDPLSLTSEHERRFWFDQGGVIVSKFQISNVPAVITRGYPNMIVEEIPLKEEDE